MHIGKLQKIWKRQIVVDLHSPSVQSHLKSWVKHRKDLLSDKDDSSEKAKYLTDGISELRAAPFFPELDFRFMNNGIKKALDKHKYGKAVGIDIISNEMLKASSPFLTDICCRLFNAIIQSSHYPMWWKTGIIYLKMAMHGIPTITRANNKILFGF